MPSDTNSSPVTRPQGSLSGRTALVTGASRGLGRAIAVALAAAGAQTVLAARTVGGLEETDDLIRAVGGHRPTLVPLDLRDGDRIDSLGAALFERHGRLDILVGNAAVLGVLSPVGHIKPATWDDVFKVNVTANYRLLRSLDPLLRRSAAGRALFVTCEQARSSRPFWSVYAASKAALEALVRSYAAEVEKFGVTANLVSPRPLRTGLRAQAYPGEDPETLPAPESVAEAVVDLVHPDATATGQLIELNALD